MFIFLAVFIIFVLILNFAIHKNNRSQENAQEQFWENERQANFTRRKDIHNLNYLTIPIEKIPQNLHTDAEKTLVRLSSDKMLNLSGITNTELKLEYGAANLDELSAYDANFTEFVSADACRPVQTGRTSNTNSGSYRFCGRNQLTCPQYHR